MLIDGTIVRVADPWSDPQVEWRGSDDPPTQYARPAAPRQPTPGRAPLDVAQSPERTIDDLCARAVSGDGRAEAALFEDLRVRFLSLAKRRVRPEHAEDVAQDALGIVLAKYRDRPTTDGFLIWSLTVLRNVIGNHYQSRRRDVERTTQVEDWRTVPEASVAVDPVETMEHEETVSMLEQGIELLARKYPRCGTIFTRILESLEKGGGQREVSQRAYELVRKSEPDLSRNSFYVALHRCRSQLRTLMEKHDLGVDHV